MKKVLKKLLAVVLTITCLAGLLVGCGNPADKETTKAQSDDKTTVGTDNKTTEAGENNVTTEAGEDNVTTEEVKNEITYPLETKTKLTLAIQADAQIKLNYPDGLGSTPFWTALQKATGVEVEVQTYENRNAMSLMFASGELPDIIFFNFANYDGGVNKAIADGIIAPITDYLEWAPDLVEVLNSDQRFLLASTTTENEYIGFPNTRGDDYMASTCGLMLRQDFLDAVKMKVPNTAEEFYQVLKAFKEQLNVEYPFSCYNNYFYQHGLGAGIFTSAFGLPKGTWYVNDGKIHYGFYEDEYKDVLAYFAKLYAEGLMDPNYSTLKIDVQRANFMNGVSGVTMGAPAGDMGLFLTTMKDDPTFDVTAFGPIVKNDGDKAMSTHYSNPVNASFAVITPACKDVEAAVKFLNYAYTEEGHMLYNFGEEGVTYNMVDGYPQYTELITNNPDGWTMQQALGAYTRAGFAFSFVSDKRYSEQYQSTPQQKNALAVWSQSDAAKYQVPAYTILAEDSNDYSRMYSDINTYCVEQTILFITGKKSIDEFDNYQAELKKMGMEECIEMSQRAYEAYMNRR